MDAVWLVRAGAYTRIDESAAIDGGMPADPQLTAGDRVIVGSAGCFQPRMVRPTSVTAPGIRVFMSNLTRPANHNAGSAIGRDSDQSALWHAFPSGVGGGQLRGRIDPERPAPRDPDQPQSHEWPHRGDPALDRAIGAQCQPR
jgi:hypothetical protein